jgi:hypothetical protein
MCPKLGLRTSLIYSRCEYVGSAQWYSYSDLAMGLAWAKDPESYAGSSIANGRASHARQVLQGRVWA